MSKQMRLVVAGASLLAVALLVWAILLRPPAVTPPLTTTDQVSTFAQPRARGANGPAPARSARAAENGSRSRPAASSTPDRAITPDVPKSAVTVPSGDVAARGITRPSAPLEFVTVGPTYDATDADVTMPVLLSPLVPRPIGRPRPEAPPGFVRILISEDGTVESARATVDPRTMGELIIITNALSMAKTWRFQPAMKNGKAVRYSLMISLNRF